MERWFIERRRRIFCKFIVSALCTCTVIAALWCPSSILSRHAHENAADCLYGGMQARTEKRRMLMYGMLGGIALLRGWRTLPLMIAAR